MTQFADVMSKEFRALGITTALAPQIDLATDPRWLRADGTMGESAKLTIDMTRAYIDAAQFTFISGHNIGWGLTLLSLWLNIFRRKELERVIENHI